MHRIFQTLLFIKRLPLKTHIRLIFFVTLLSACGSGGGSSAPPAPTTPTASKGTLSGRLIVPPNHIIETEPNHTIALAQPLAEDSAISGHVSLSESGFPFPGLSPGNKIEDLYGLNTSGRVRITLHIAEDDLEENDLDLVLMDLSGNMLDLSEGLVASEFIETTGAGNFIIGVRAFQGTSAYVLNIAALGSLSASALSVPIGADFVPGELFVKMKPGNTEKVGREKTAALQHKHKLSHQATLLKNINLMRIQPPLQTLQKNTNPLWRKSLTANSTQNSLKALTLQILETLAQDENVIYAEPNFIRKPLLTPNDDLYHLQWHYPLINLPQAWDLSTGSDAVIIAVLDTGVLLNHPDLQTRLISGYDFVSDPTSAKDGDGIDADPNDPGDDANGASSSFHGTHVAGTLGARTNNTTGVAGVTWQTKLMPLRVLGVGGGSTFDVVQAMLYAAKLNNSSGTLPAKRANIINLSLGGPGFSQTEQDIINTVGQAGVIIVAAAGNDNTNVPYYPASYAGVISVAAVDGLSRKASYSNFGTNIDLAAPGGDGLNDAILSTMGDDSGRFFFRYAQGTSMATPHVAGVLALMLAVNPNITPRALHQLIEGTHPETTRNITRDLGDTGRDDFYGHGLIDAAQALIAAGEISGGSGNLPTGSILNLSTNTLNFFNFMDTLPIDLSNAGIGNLQITSVSENADWLSVTPQSGTAPMTLQVTVDRTGLPEGSNTAEISIVSDAASGPQIASLTVNITTGGATVGNVGTVFILLLDGDTQEPIAQGSARREGNYRFQFTQINPGNYTLVAGTDRDQDGFICDIEDACGTFSEKVMIQSGEETSDIDFIVSDLIATLRTQASKLDEKRKTFKRLN